MFKGINANIFGMSCVHYIKYLCVINMTMILIYYCLFLHIYNFKLNRAYERAYQEPGRTEQES